MCFYLTAGHACPFENDYIGLKIDVRNAQAFLRNRKSKATTRRIPYDHTIDPFNIGDLERQRPVENGQSGATTEEKNK